MSNLYIRHKQPEYSDPISFSLGQMLPEAHKQPEWIIKGLLRQGEQLMVYAAPGNYKSWFTTALGMAAAGGTALLQDNGGNEWLSPKKHKVLVVDGEMAGYELAGRYAALFPHYGGTDLEVLPRCHQKHKTQFINLSDTRDIDALYDKVIADKVELLILDNLSTVAQLDDENSATSFYNLLEGLLMFKNAGVAVVVVHHANKTGGSYRGSTMLATTFNKILKLEKVSGEKGRIKVSFDKFRESGVDDSILLDLKEFAGGSLRFERNSEDRKYQYLVELLKTYKYAKDVDLIPEMSIYLDCSVTRQRLADMKRRCFAMGLISPEEWASIQSGAKVSQHSLIED